MRRQGNYQGCLRITRCFALSSAALWLMVGVLVAGNPSASASGTKQTCFSKLLRPPHGVTSVMLVPHKTEVLTKGSYRAVKGCDNWQRLGRYKVQIKQSGRWRDLAGNFWYPTNQGVADKNAAYKFGFLDFATRSVHEECIRGHWQRARVRFLNLVRNTKTGKIAARGKIKNQRVKIGQTAHCEA